MTALHWPKNLTDDTPLPYSTWRVLDLVDGRRDAPEIARLLKLTSQEVQHTLDESGRWIGRAAQREQVVTRATADDVAQCLTAVVGPVAPLMVDEVLDELGDQPTLSALLSGIAAQLSPERLQQFARNLRERGMA